MDLLVGAANTIRRKRTESGWASPFPSLIGTKLMPGEEKLPFAGFQRQENSELQESSNRLYGLTEWASLLIEAAQVSLQCPGHVVACGLFSRAHTDNPELRCDCVPLAVSATDEGTHRTLGEPGMEAPASSDSRLFARGRHRPPTYTMRCRPKQPQLVFVHAASGIDAVRSLTRPDTSRGCTWARRLRSVADPRRTR